MPDFRCSLQIGRRHSMAANISGTVAASNRDEALKDLYDRLTQENLFPFWATSTAVDHDEVRQLLASHKAIHHVWSFADTLEQLLHQSAELVSMSDSARRSLILVNPYLAPQLDTRPTLYTSNRLNY